MVKLWYEYDNICCYGHLPLPLILKCSARLTLCWSLASGIETDVDIQKTIHTIRQQRSGMVQTEAQYKFCYLAVKHHIDALKTRIQAEQQADDSSLYGNIAGASNLVPGGKALGLR